MQSEKDKTYFTYLDALRCLAFLGVFYAHTGTIFTGSITTREFPLNIWNSFTVYGSYGVNFFFVLSGFLITYLLLKERKATGGVHVKNFYIKRILRIWPVYFMTLFFAAIILPFLISSETYSVFTMANPDMSLRAFLYTLFFAENFYQGLWIGMGPLSIGILWSVAVEEQFYLVWPWIVKWFNPRNLTYVIAFLISLTLLYKFIWAEDRMANYYLPWSVGMDLGFGALLGSMYWNGQVKKFIGIMASVFMGSVLLILATRTNLLDILRLVKTPILDSIFALVILFFLEKRNGFSSFFQTILGNVGNRTKTKILSFMTYLGKISYGLYSYHTICLMLTVSFLFSIGFLDRDVSRTEFFTVIILAFILTIIVARLSYRYVESRFLTLKDKLK